MRSCWGSRWGSRSSSSSVCSEDVAARCWEDTGGIYEEEDDGSGQDGALLPWQCPEQDESPELMRRGSLESLGARISRLSQSGADTPCLASSKHPAQGRGDASHWGPHSIAKPSVTSLHGGDGEAGHRRRPSSSSASKSRARAVGHHRWQELPARRGWHGGDFILAAKKEDGDGRRRALCEYAVGLGVLGAEAGVQEGLQGAWWGQGPSWGWVMVGPCGSEGGQPRASPTRWWVCGVPNLLLQAPKQQWDLLGDAAPGQRGSMGCLAQGMQQSPGGSTGSRRPSCPTGCVWMGMVGWLSPYGGPWVPHRTFSRHYNGHGKAVSMGMFIKEKNCEGNPEEKPSSVGAIVQNQFVKVIAFIKLISCISAG